MHEKEAKTILSTQNGINLYCGCTCGCLGCAARSACRRMKTPFEDVEVRVNAAELLEVSLRRKRSKCMIVTGTMGDPYQACEEQYGLMRRCLELIDRYGFGVSIQTRSARIARDAGILASIHRKSRCVVEMSLCTMDAELSRKMEAGASAPEERVRALETLRDAGIPVIVRLDPVLPFLNDSLPQLEKVLEACMGLSVHGVHLPSATLSLRPGERDAFLKRLGEQFPDLPARYQAAYGDAIDLKIRDFEALDRGLRKICADFHLACDSAKLFTWQHAFVDRQAGEQLSLFDLYPEQMAGGEAAAGKE